MRVLDFFYFTENPNSSTSRRGKRNHEHSPLDFLRKRLPLSVLVKDLDANQKRTISPSIDPPAREQPFRAKMFLRHEITAAGHRLWKNKLTLNIEKGSICWKEATASVEPSKQYGNSFGCPSFLFGRRKPISGILPARAGFSPEFFTSATDFLFQRPSGEKLWRFSSVIIVKFKCKNCYRKLVTFVVTSRP